MQLRQVGQVLATARVLREFFQHIVLLILRYGVDIFEGRFARPPARRLLIGHTLLIESFLLRQPDLQVV